LIADSTITKVRFYFELVDNTAPECLFFTF
jgi:hypothetical protein